MKYQYIYNALTVLNKFCHNNRQVIDKDYEVFTKHGVLLDSYIFIPHDPKKHYVYIFMENYLTCNSSNYKFLKTQYKNIPKKIREFFNLDNIEEKTKENNFCEVE